MREHITSIVTSNTQIIWCLNAHVGRIDEYNAAGHKNYSHTDGGYWDSHPIEGARPILYNSAVRALAHTHGDYVLDNYGISKQLVLYSNKVKEVRLGSEYQIHIDALQYCAGGLFRASLQLLYNLIIYHQDCGANTHISAV